ncbi:unnamed protein product [Rangifer tarandus platyrhynchus]|uniref:Uncharacterized protein n=2 Tax=Rangifer tarandus platyrhynchus TaxID=3082113 RepID=A0ABN9A262_RANTA|nr:unnamed protein product [Rangifer tarandus platyrhynchus]
MELFPWEGERECQGASGIPPPPCSQLLGRNLKSRSVHVIVYSALQPQKTHSAAEWSVESQGHSPPWAFPALIHLPAYPEPSVITTGFTRRSSGGLASIPTLGSHHRNILTGNNLEWSGHPDCGIGYASLRRAGLELTQTW